LDSLENVTWLGHSGIRISGDKIIYFDPFKINAGPAAAIILITHDHYDHFDPESISKITKSDTIIVGTENVCRRLNQAGRPVRPGDQINIGNILIEAVPSYNIGKKYHPRENQNVGYILHLPDAIYYHAGDTDRIPEMKKIRTDIAFLPVSGTFTMDAAEAAAATDDIQPRIAIPIHWGTICGSRTDAERFQKLTKCDVIIPNRGK